MPPRTARHAPARRVVALVVLALGLGLSVLTACSSDDDGGGPRTTTPTATPSAAPPPPAAPEVGACYDLPFDAAVAPTSSVEPTGCRTKHTSETVAVGTIDALADGHLLAVDSEQVQAQVAAACPASLTKYVGGGVEQLRLSMIRPIWFTPTVEESDEGATWFRCDAVVTSGDSKLVPLTASLKGALDRAGTRERFAMCGTAAPGAKNFEHVVCSGEHRWRAIDVVTFKKGRYPGAKTVRAAGRARCEDAAADVSDDPLVFQWGYEWPTKEQWAMGQHFGRCWAKE